eukprot:gene24696-31626_t
MDSILSFAFVAGTIDGAPRSVTMFIINLECVVAGPS